MFSDAPTPVNVPWSKEEELHRASAVVQSNPGLGGELDVLTQVVKEPVEPLDEIV
jgi:hypothetical protein